MSIAPVRPDECDAAYAVFDACRNDLLSQGIRQWTEIYPQRRHVEGDIQGACIYAVKSLGRIDAVISLNEEQDPQYDDIHWQDMEGHPLIIHRLAVHPRVQRKGLAATLMDFAEFKALHEGYSSVRLDAFTGNPVTLGFYERRGYIKRGECLFPGRDLPFACMEKMIGETDNV